MANWALPQLSDLKVDVLEMLKAREVDAYVLAEAPINPPVGAKRWNTALNLFQAWNGTAWVTMVVGIAGGGTGATDINGFLGNFGLGSMALQNNNAVNITGGSITGLSALGVSGNLTVAGIITAGSSPTTVTTSAGLVRREAIENNVFIADINVNEVVSGRWVFTSTVSGANSQLELQGSNNPTLILNNLSHAVNARKARVLHVNNVIRFDFVDDAESAVIGGALTIDNAGSIGTGGNLNVSNIVAGGGITGASIHATSGNYLASDASSALVLGPAAVTMFADQYDWINKINTAYRMRLDSANNLTVSGSIKAGSGHYLKNDNAPGLALISPNATIYADTFYVLNTAQTVQLLFCSSSGLTIAGPTFALTDGANSYRLSGNATEVTSYANTTTWRSSIGTFLMSLSPGGILNPSGALSLPNGSTSAPALRFANLPGAGIYYNSGAGTLEFGGIFDSTNRSVMRCYTGVAGGKVDFLVGTDVFYTMGPWPNHRVAGHFSPTSPNNYYLGEPSLAWYQIHSLYGVVTTSDINVKDVHGPVPDNILDLIDSIDPLITSFKVSERPNDSLVPEEDFFQRFPSFSAQDIREKIDEPLGIKTVFGDERLGLDYGKLTPLLWQAIRKLHARVKALEN